MDQLVYDAQLEGNRWTIVQAVSIVSQARSALMVVHVFAVNLENKYKCEASQRRQHFGAACRPVEIAVCAKFVHLGKCQSMALPVQNVA